jgi:hypothetical protein
MADKYDLIVVGAGPGEERGGASPHTAPPHGQDELLRQLRPRFSPVGKAHLRTQKVTTG